MRDLILERLNDLKRLSRGFPQMEMRWQNYFLDDKREIVYATTKRERAGLIHFSEVVFTELDDKHLLDVFEKILWQYARQY